MKSCLFTCAVLALAAWSAGAEPAFRTRGVVLTPKDLSGELDWPKLAHEAGLTTIATHIGPADVMPFLRSGKGEKFLADCRKYGLQVEHELHAMGYLLPRRLFKERPDLFRMDKSGQRTARQNCCVASVEALAIIASNAVEVAKVCRSTTGRYFYWLDDSSDICHCAKCRELNASEQTLVIENAILAALREKIDPKATLAHLAYGVTMVAPEKVRPVDGIFLEYANIGRNRAQPLDGKERALLARLLEIFPVDTAQVLEYWLDVSLFSEWHKPYVKLPWSANCFRADVDDYAQMGFRHFTTFAVYLDDEYLRDFGNMDEVRAYGKGLAEWPYAERPVRDRFLVPGCVEVSKDAFGEEVVTLRGRGGSAVVSLRGAQVRSWKPVGQEEVLYCPPEMRFDGTTEVRGGIPLSWPWFGRCGETNSLPHGFARHCLFTISKCRADAEQTRVDLKLVGAEWNRETKDLWPQRIHLDYTIVLAADGALEIKALTTHIGEAGRPYVVTEGLHPYWRVSDRRTVRVKGLDGLAFCDADKTEVAAGAWKGNLVPDRHFDHVFTMKRGEASIEDPGFGRRISMSFDGLPKLVVWTPGAFAAGAFENLPPEDLLKFVCVEPARLFRPEAYALDRLEKHAFSVKFRCEPLASGSDCEVPE